MNANCIKPESRKKPSFHQAAISLGRAFLTIQHPIETSHVFPMPNCLIFLASNSSVSQIFYKTTGPPSKTGINTKNLHTAHSRGAAPFLDPAYMWYSSSFLKHPSFPKLRHALSIIFSQFWSKSIQVVLDLFGGTEPHNFHTCIHRTLRSWKNKMLGILIIIIIIIIIHLFKVGREIDS